MDILSEGSGRAAAPDSPAARGTRGQTAAGGFRARAARPATAARRPGGPQAAVPAGIVRHALVSLTAAAAAAAMAVSGPAGAPIAAASPRTAAAERSSALPSARAVVAWNRLLVEILGHKRAQPPAVHPTRSFAMLQAAEYDAVVSVTRSGPAYLFRVRAPRRASPEAAADQAAYDVLRSLHPAFRQRLDRELYVLLAAVPDGPGKRAGRRVGAQVAHRLILDRAHDGSSAVPPLVSPGRRPGEYRPTQPGGKPKYTGWGQVRPFVLASGRQFRPPPPPRVSSARYAAALSEVMVLGRDRSKARSPKQTRAAGFWSATPAATLWNQAAQRLVTDEHADLVRAVRVFACLDLSLADTTIAVFNAKYHYYRWRPVTAIRLGGTHYNRFISGDPGWTPLEKTPLDPSYPSGHTALSEAAAVALAAFYGRHQPVSFVSGDWPRSFGSLQAAAREAGLSRIWAGEHHPYDLVASRGLADRVARFVGRALMHGRTGYRHAGARRMAG